MPVRPLYDPSRFADTTVSNQPLSCVSCGLHKEVLTPRMPPFGDGKKGIMLIGEGPGETEDRRGKPFQGKTGNALKAALADLGIDLFKDCVSVNAVNCRPPNNRGPSPHEMACCRKIIVNPAILKHMPKLIILLGGSAVTSVIGGLLPDAVGDAISRWRGFQIPIPNWHAWLCSTFHPSYILREEHKPEIETVWLDDLKQAIKLLDVPVPDAENLRDRITILKGEEAILRALQRAKVRKGLFSFDYECTGLRASLHTIICASFCQSPDKAYAFMMNGSDAVKQAWRDILVDPEIGKISHNLAFEYEWSRHHFELDEMNWAWDSMLAAHVLDNRAGICGLKHQAFLNFGIPAYDDQISSFLKSTDDRDPAALNRISQFIERHGEDELLYYNGIDSLVAYRLALKQMREIQ